MLPTWGIFCWPLVYIEKAKFTSLTHHLLDSPDGTGPLVAPNAITEIEIKQGGLFMNGHSPINIANGGDRHHWWLLLPLVVFASSTRFCAAGANCYLSDLLNLARLKFSGRLGN
jgi:hypothetical protein